MPDMQTLRNHLVNELRDLLDAEQQLTSVLRDLADRAATPALRTAFEQHLEETERHIDRLGEAFAALEEPARPKRCEGMQGLIREGQAVLSSVPRGALCDAMMITSSQKVEHYEMASYGTARTYAQVLSQPKVARLLQDTLDEEKAADAKLTEIAQGHVNDKAAEEWHHDQEAVGLLEHTATLAGQAVGLGARTVKRAANAIGLGRAQQSGGNAPGVLQSMASVMNRGVEAAGDTLRDAADSAASQVRRVTQPSGNSARKAAAGATTSRARRSKPKAKTASRHQSETRKSKAR